MSELEGNTPQEYENWTADSPEESDNTETKDKNIGDDLVHRYFFENQTNLLDNVPVEQRIQVISQMLEVDDGPIVVIDCCLGYIKDPAEQTVLAELLLKAKALASAIAKKELENVESETIAAFLVAEGDAAESYDFFAYKAIDSVKVGKILNEKFGYKTDKLLDYLDLIRVGANYYDIENKNDDPSRFERSVESFLNKCGLDYQRLRSIWFHNGASLDRDAEGLWRMEALSHLDTIMSLELREGGSARRLMEAYGIENYGRYGFEVLQRQLEEESDSTTPYGIIMYAKADYEGMGFRSSTPGRNEGRVLSTLQDDLRKEGYLLRIIEVGAKTSMLHRVLSLKKRYEATAGKIKFGALAAHGSELKMILRDKREGGDWDTEIDIQDLYKLNYPKSELQQRDTRAFEEFLLSFDKGIDFALLSCSTAGGDEDNIAKAGSRATSFAVTGPQTIAGRGNIKVFRQGGRLRISQYYNVPRRTYRGGAEEEINEYAA